MKESVPQIESKEKPQEKIIDLFTMSQEQGDSLKNEIGEHHGLVRVFIHQDYISSADYPKISFGIARTLLSKDSPPLIFLEEHNLLDTFLKGLSELEEELPNSVYFVKTLTKVPYPIFPGDPTPQETEFNKTSTEEQDKAIRGMQLLGLVFQDLGVKKILVGGANLVAYNPERLQECVGNFVELFNETGNFNFNIKVSNLTIPDNREDLKGERNEFV